MQNEDKIKAALLSALREPTSLHDCEESIVNKLYAAIVPHMAPSPDWSEAPEWATHLAQDQSGQWHWFKSEPRTEAGYWVAKGDTNARAFSKNPNWKETLEARPE